MQHLKALGFNSSERINKNVCTQEFIIYFAVCALRSPMCPFTKGCHAPQDDLAKTSKVSG